VYYYILLYKFFFSNKLKLLTIANKNIKDKIDIAIETNMNNLTKEELSQTFIKACQLGDFDTVKKLYEQSSDKRGLKLKFLTKEVIFNAHDDKESALRAANHNGHYEIVKFFLEEKDFIKNLEDKQLLTKLFNNSVSNGFLITSKNFEITTLVVPLLQEHKILNNKQILLGFIEVCATEDIKTLEYLAENFDIYSTLPLMTSNLPYSLQEHGFIAACEEGSLESVKFLLTSPKIKERIDLDNIITKVRIQHQHILEYLVFDFGIARDSSFTKKIVNENLDSLLEKRDVFNSLNSDLKSNNKSQSRIKV
jgi:hypothetical protein